MAPTAGSWDRPALLESVYGLSAEEARVWSAYLDFVDRKEAGEKVTRPEVLASLGEDLVPMDFDDGFPPHLLARVSRTDPRLSSVIFSQHLELVRSYPGLAEAFTTDGPDDGSHADAMIAYIAQLHDETAGLHLLGLPRLDRVERILRAAALKEPESGLARRILVELLDRQGRVHEAHAVLESIGLQGHHQDLPLVLDRATVFAREGLYRDAGRWIRDHPVESGGAGAPDRVEERRAIARAYQMIFDAFGGDDAESLVLVQVQLAAFLREIRGFVGKLDGDEVGRALEFYRRSPEGTELRRTAKGGSPTPIGESHSFALYLAFAYRSEGIQDPPAQRFIDIGEAPSPLSWLVRTAVRGSRRGPFPILDDTEARDGWVQVRVADFLTGERLGVCFPTGSPARGSRDPGPSVFDQGSVLRTHLVPWGRRWVPRGPILLFVPTEAAPGRMPPTRWILDVHPVRRGRETFWTATVMAEESVLIVGTSVGEVLGPGLLIEALDHAVRTTGREPDLLVTRGGYPFWVPREGSLLWHWAAARGIRHAIDDRLASEMSRDYRALAEGLEGLGRGTMSRSRGPMRGAAARGRRMGRRRPPKKR